MKGFKLKIKRSRPSMSRKIVLGLGSIAAILLLSSVISILEYRRMSDYVSDLIAANIKSINRAERLSDITQEYHHQMLAVVLANDISIMPDFDLHSFKDLSDSLKSSVSSKSALPLVDSVVVSFDKFMQTSLRFDEVFLADSVDAGQWFFGTLNPSYNEFRKDMNTLNEHVYTDLKENSEDFDAGFYRSIIPGVVSVAAGLILVFLMLCFAMMYYVRPIYRMADGLNAYRQSGRKYVYTFEGDDQLSDINNGIIEVVDENIELKGRIRSLKAERNS